MSRVLRGRPRPSERGFVLIVVLGIMTTLVMLVVGFLSLTKTEADMAVHIQDAARTEQAAWGAIEYLIANITSQAFGAHGTAMKADYYTTRCLQDPNGWWYREYRPLISVDRTEADDWDWQAAQWVTFPNIEPWHGASWMYFPDGNPNPTIRAGQQLRMEIHVLDENAFINTNDWLYDHAPTAAQQANMLAALIPPTFLERDYAITNGYCPRDLTSGRPTLGSDHDLYQRTRIKPVEAWIQATDCRRKRKVAYAGHPTMEGTLPHLMTNMEYEPSEGIYGWGTYDGAINQLRYSADGHWNTSVYGDARDNSSEDNLCHVNASVERLGYQDPDTGLSPLNVNTAARSLEPEFQNGWDGYPWASVAEGSCMNVTEALVPAEALWQLLIVDPSDTDNGTTAGAARIIVSDAYLETWMDANPEIAGSWADPDGDGDPVGGFGTGLDPSTTTDPQDLVLYKEARQEIVERKAWLLAFQYQETICRWLMGSYWDMRVGEGEHGHNSTNGNTTCSGAGGDWDEDYAERYPAVAAEQARYALSNNPDSGTTVGARHRETVTRWPGSRAAFWADIEGGLRDLSTGSLTETVNWSGSAQLPSKVSVDDEGDLEIQPGKIDQWIADAVYNSLRPGMGHNLHGNNPLLVLSNNEDDGCFDSKYQTAWGVSHDWRSDTTAGASMGCRFPGAAFPAYMKFGGFAPHNDGVYKNLYSATIDGTAMNCYFPARNIYVLLYDGASPPEEEPPGMTPRSVKTGLDGTSRRQYWRKQFTPNSMATEITNASTTFRFVTMGQIVKVNDPDDVMDDRVFYERRLAGFFEIAPDIADESVGAVTANKDAGEWYGNGMPAYWRANLNFEGWRLQPDANAPAGYGWDSSDLPNGTVSRRHGDPRYRLGEAPLGQHDRWYDFRGFHYSNYGGVMQTKRRVQFLHFIDNNLR